MTDETNTTTAEVVDNGAFLDSLTRNNAKIRKDRAAAIGEDAELMYKRKVEDLQVKLNRMTRDRENMLDMSPDTAMSLKVASDFNAEEFVGKDLEISVTIRNTTIELEIARARYTYLFGKEI